MPSDASNGSGVPLTGRGRAGVAGVRAAAVGGASVSSSDRTDEGAGAGGTGNSTNADVRGGCSIAGCSVGGGVSIRATGAG